MSPAEDTLVRLQAAQDRAKAAHRENVERKSALAGQVRHTERIVERFTRRRDQLLAAGEANGHAGAQQVAGLTATADRLRKQARNSLGILTEALAAATERCRKSSELVQRTDTAAAQLTNAVKNLELVRMERENRDRLADLERASMISLQQLGGGSKPARRGTFVEPDAADSTLDDCLREVTRLAYEAEALADLQRGPSS